MFKSIFATRSRHQSSSLNLFPTKSGFGRNGVQRRNPLITSNQFFSGQQKVAHQHGSKSRNRSRTNSINDSKSINESESCVSSSKKSNTNNVSVSESKNGKKKASSSLIQDETITKAKTGPVLKIPTDCIVSSMEKLESLALVHVTVDHPSDPLVEIECFEERWEGVTVFLVKRTWRAIDSLGNDDVKTQMVEIPK